MTTDIDFKGHKFVPGKSDVTFYSVYFCENCGVKLRISNHSTISGNDRYYYFSQVKYYSIFPKYMEFLKDELSCEEIIIKDIIE